MIISRENLILSIPYIIGTQGGLAYSIHIMHYQNVFNYIYAINSFKENDKKGLVF